MWEQGEKGMWGFVSNKKFGARAVGAPFLEKDGPLIP